MRRLANYFLQGLIFVAPVAVTVYVCWTVFTRVDRWVGLSWPGVGFVATISLVTLVGFLASNLLTRGAVGVLERALTRLPLVRLLYSSTKDLMNAVVGEKRRFDKPVTVPLFFPGAGPRVFGFVTQESLAQFGLEDHVAVYVPHSYSLSGHLALYPANQVRPVSAETADVMAFVVSGGVTRVQGSSTAAPPDA
jgi:uncharacterized membrane protein